MFNTWSTCIALLGTPLFALAILVSVLMPVVVAVTVLVAVPVLVAVITVLPATFCLSLVGVLILRPTLIVVGSIVVSLLPSVSGITSLRISTLSPVGRLGVAISLITPAFGPVAVTTTRVAHYQTTHLVGIFHADQVAIGRKTVVDIEVITIAEVIVVVLDSC